MERERIEMSCFQGAAHLGESRCEQSPACDFAMSMPNPIMYTDWAALSALVFAVVLVLIAYIDLSGLYR